MSWILNELAGGAAQRTVQKNLDFLRQLGLVELSGHGRGARWALVGESRPGTSLAPPPTDTVRRNGAVRLCAPFQTQRAGIG